MAPSVERYVAVWNERDDVQRRQAIAELGPDLVINAAAYNHVDGAESNAIDAYRSNALGPRNLALVTAAAGIPLLHVSTDYVFDGAAKRPYHEYDRPRPLSTYGLSKLAGEVAVRELNPRHYLLRTAFLFHPAGGNFLNTMLSLSQRPQVKVIDDQFGSPTCAAFGRRNIWTDTNRSLWCLSHGGAGRRVTV